MGFEGKVFRHELKYYINYGDYLLLKNKIKYVLKPDPNACQKGEYFIRSLYFDDIYNSALFEKNFGIYRRYKYRIRIYNMDDKIIRLERKSRIDRYICKETEKITREEYGLIYCNKTDSIKTAGGYVRRDFFLDVTNKILKPKVIVDYDREAFMSDMGNVRITFDKQLRVAYSSNDIFNESIASKCLVPLPRMIMEVKYNGFLPDVVRNLMNINAGEFSAISKYVICRTQKNNI